MTVHTDVDPGLVERVAALEERVTSVSFRLNLLWFIVGVLILALLFRPLAQLIVLLGIVLAIPAAIVGVIVLISIVLNRCFPAAPSCTETATATETVGIHPAD
ncbi:MAG: hypothetical protein KDA96_26445 [Planctomycetaceae bacterium]|nr:hypothetical protein [Planctomycetaceae bacterium]